jgi:hypothetical protein
MQHTVAFNALTITVGCEQYSFNEMLIDLYAILSVLAPVYAVYD